MATTRPVKDLQSALLYTFATLEVFLAVFKIKSFAVSKAQKVVRRSSGVAPWLIKKRRRGVTGRVMKIPLAVTAGT